MTGWVDIGLSAADLEASGPTAVEVEGRYLVVGQADAGLFAIEDMCSHAACRFSTDGEIDGGVAICNCHGSEFDLFSGEVLAPPAREAIRVFQVNESSGEVKVRL